MFTRKLYKVIGIMSGTSMDGVDLSLIETDGNKKVLVISEKSYEYTNNYKNKLKNLVKLYYSKKNINNRKKENFVTKKFIQMINKFIKENKINKDSIDYIGFSGQTIYHNPSEKKSIQLGSCKEIQKNIKIKVVGNFRDNDVQNGGQGAPIGAFYHKYIIDKLSNNSAILNIGGISNISLIKDKKLIAFDMGPGNSLIDDLMLFFYKKNFDFNGKKASKGKKNNRLLLEFKKDIFFKNHYPKSLDREYFKKYCDKLKLINHSTAITTASYMTIEGIIMGLVKINYSINNIILTGGGRKNHFIVKKLTNILKKRNIKIELIENLGLDGDFLEAQAFGYLAIRSLLKLPISLPTTTGVKKPLTGGKIYK